MSSIFQYLNDKIVGSLILSSIGAMALGLYKYKQVQSKKENNNNEYVKILPCGCVVRFINDDDGNISVEHKCEIKMDPGITQTEINLNTLNLQLVSDKN